MILSSQAREGPGTHWNPCGTRETPLEGESGAVLLCPSPSPSPLLFSPRLFSSLLSCPLSSPPHLSSRRLLFSPFLSVDR